MSIHKATIRWKNNETVLEYDTYNRNHQWDFEGGANMVASAAKEYKGEASKPNPEEALVAAVSSCHMLTFLAICSRKRFVVDSYTDNAVGIMAINKNNRMAITKVTLTPKIVFSGDNIPTAAIIDDMHKRSHTECFIANSVNFEIEIIR